MLLAGLHRNSRIAIVAVVLFLVFDFAALGLNFWLSWKIEQQAIAINLAGRQRMLSQRMVKSMLQINEDRNNPKDAVPHREELAYTYALFNDTLQGFARGHQTRSGNNQTLFLPAVRGDAAQQLTQQAETLWKPYASLVQAVIQADDIQLKSTLAPALSYAVEHNLEMLDLMNRLTTELERQTQKEAAQIRWFQGIAFALALLNFFGAFALYLHRIQLMSRSHGLLDNIINKVPTCVLVADQKRQIVKANHTAERLFGHSQLVGLPLSDLIAEHNLEYEGKRQDGTRFPAACEYNQVLMDERMVTIITVTDITQQRKTEAHLSTLAYHDMLTSLPNRQLFDDRLNQEIARAERNSTGLGLLFLDLDKFKPVNDRYGHDIGDKLLQQVAVRLKSSLREVDTVSRWGGDEFTVLLPQVADREACEKVAQALIEQISQPFLVDGLHLIIGVSIGISFYPEDGSDALMLLTHADESMYQAKQAGRNTYCSRSGTA